MVVRDAYGRAPAGFPQRALMLLAVFLAHSAAFGAAFAGGDLVDECSFVAKQHRGAGSLPVVVFLVGLEGSGHHLVAEVMSHILPKVGRLDFSQEVNYWKDTKAPAGSSFLTYLDRNPDVRVFEAFSYPAGKPGRYDANARVSLVKLVCLNATGAIDLRLAYLRRDPVDAVCSTLRRFVKNVAHAVERTTDIALESFLYIFSVLNHEGVAYEVIDFAEAIKDKKSMQRQLESLLRDLATPEAINTAIEQSSVEASFTVHHDTQKLSPKTRKRPSCNDVQTRNIVASSMKPANNGLLHATLKNGPIKDYWQLDIESLRGAGEHAHALHNLTRATSTAPGLSGARATAEDMGEEPVPNEVTQSSFKAATGGKVSEEQRENNLPHGTPSWHPARSHRGRGGR